MPSRRLHWPAAAALALIVGLPAIADAQLFPNLPIKRQRTACCNEPPVYRLYRQEFYGYHPTCWRRFPEGWGCPSPEAPNTAQAIQEINDEIKRLQQQATEPLGEAAPPGPGFPGDFPPGNMPPDIGIPDLPERERQPFPLDSTPGTGQPPGPFGGTPPGAGAFEAPPAPNTVDADEPSATVTLLDVGNPSTPPPIPNSLPPDNLPWPAPPGTSEPDPSTAPSIAAAMTPPPAPAPGVRAFPDHVHAPPRRGVLGGLFQNMNRRWR